MQYKVLFNMQDHKQDLKHIREMMEKSSRFISLSGLSGIFAGVIALISAGIAYYLFIEYRIDYFEKVQVIYSEELIVRLFVLAVTTLFVAICGGVFFTYKKSRKRGQPIWTKNTIGMLLHISIILVTGGVFCILLLYHDVIYLIAPCMLIFYGLALVSGSKFTYGEIKYLGILEIVLGLLGCIFIGYGLVLWAIGFGVLHIIYGIVMYNKYK